MKLTHQASRDRVKKGLNILRDVLIIAESSCLLLVVYVTNAGSSLLGLVKCDYP